MFSSCGAFVFESSQRRPDYEFSSWNSVLKHHARSTTRSLTTYDFEEHSGAPLESHEFVSLHEARLGNGNPESGCRLPNGRLPSCLPRVDTSQSYLLLHTAALWYVRPTLLTSLPDRAGCVGTLGKPAEQGCRCLTIPASCPFFRSSPFLHERRK